MRLAIAQIDPVVGDIQGNVGKVLEAVARAEAEQAGLTLFPELVLTGYPPEDLLAKEHFIEDGLDALEQVAAACRHMAVVGFVDRVGDRLYNAAALCGNMRVLRVYHKRRLPNYGVFDEDRYFEPGDTPGLVEVGGDMFALTVCEDVWTPELVAEAADEGARLVVNVSASPFHLGKGLDREAMLIGRAMESGLWVAYCNMVGGQDELVFDGRSVVVSPTGEIVARARSFAEDFLLVDFSPRGKLGARADVAPMLDGEEEVYGALVLGLRDYMAKNGFTDAVVGLSGGIDSALTAAIAAGALGPGAVLGVAMPSRYSSGHSREDAAALARNLGVRFREIPIEPMHAAFLAQLEAAEGRPLGDLAEQNVQARVRGQILMALSNDTGGLVLSTGNKSELAVGYCTLYGDMAGGLAVIGDVAKTLVYRVARAANLRAGRPVIPERTFTKPPSAELKPGQVDQDSLPPYEVLDDILAAFVEERLPVDAIVARGHPEETVRRVLRMVVASEYKRRQAAPVLKVSEKAFGEGRRLPIAHGWRY